MDETIFKKISPSELDNKSLVLTVNERLSRWLLLQHNRRKKNEDKKIWITPAIKSLDSWTRELWKQSWPEKYILNSTQSQSLWENIIRKDFYSDQTDLLHLRGAADLAAKAYKLVKQYHLPESQTPYNWTEESKSFHRWMKSYESKLKTLNSIDPSYLLDEIISIQKRNSHFVPEQIVIAGFDEINPQFENWIRFLVSKNVQIEILKSSSESLSNRSNEIKSSDVCVRSFFDRSQEITQCARWVRSVYSVEKTIGIIVPEMEDYRSQIIREFTSELAPDAMFPWKETEVPFNISKGTPLSNEPAINLATHIISAPINFIPHRTFYSVLTSPFIRGSEQERSGRMFLEKYLRRNNFVKIFLGQINNWDKKETVPQLIYCLEVLENFLKNDISALPSIWAKRFSNLLKQMGWPFGDNEENATFFPLLDKWNECLDIFASLDNIIGLVNRDKAVEILNKIIEIPYSQKSSEEAIQILGMLESSGLEFDYLWVMGCDMKSLPAPSSPNPFIPINIQKQHNLPHSTAGRELNYANQIIERLLTASPNIVFSYAKWENNTEQFISPMLTSIKELSPSPTIDQSHSPSLQIQTSFPLELWEDQPTIPISQEELHHIKGGHNIIGNMAMCPFRAFAVHRLHTQSIEDPEIDIDAAKRGDLVHKSMELFWNQVKSHDNLIKLCDEDKLVSQVSSVVYEAIQKNQNHFFHQPIFTEMETERIISLVLDWLEVDLSRPPFKVLSTEEQIQLKIGELNLNLKIDRVDQSETGEIVIIDYKTGKPNIADWFQIRLTQPQLPLYSLNKSASAIVFAVIKKNSCSFKGMAKNPEVIPDIHFDIYKKYTSSKSWEDQINLWRDILNNLSNDFISGNLEVNPVNPKTTCKYCGLQGLCKVGDQETFENEDNLDG
ncbi:MAG: PD-(D/E)XK nuclease family protein [Nitrospinales bacterium]